MAHITWLSLERLEEEWASDFGSQNLFFAPLVTIQMPAAELASSIERPSDTELMEGLGEFHSWGGRAGLRLFQLLAPKTEAAHAGLSVCPLAPGEIIRWSVLNELTDLPQPLLSRVVRVHNQALDRAPQPGHFALYFRGPSGEQLPMYFAETAQEVSDVKGFLRWHGVPMELVVAQLKSPTPT
jgi:hypothetical protein